MPRSQTDRDRSTLRDVAAEAGVSVATVSRVLNGSDLVGAETRERVNAAIDSLKFTPSAAARSLNSGRTRTIGALVPTIDHSIFARYLNALENGLSELGYALVVAVTGGVPDVETQKAQKLLNLGVDALIVSGVERQKDFQALAALHRVPVLITSFYDPTADYPTIGYDNATIAANAVSYLRSKGHRSIAVIHGPTETSDRIAARVEGARRQADGTELDYIRAELSVAGGAAAVRELLERGSGATAVFCLSDVQALGALFELQRAGRSVPGDMSIMGFDNLDWSAVSVPGITTMELPSVEMGKFAATSIVEWLSSGQRAAPMKLPAYIVERESVADLRRNG